MPSIPLPFSLRFLPLSCWLCGLLLGLAGAAASLHGQITEWPATVEPGRFLLEMDTVSITTDKDSGGKYTAFGAASTFLTTGLSERWDVQIGAELYISQKYDSSGLSDRNSGIGDVYFRTKWRFYEDKESGTAIAVLPYVKIPTNTGGVGNDAMEGGVIVPWATKLAGGVNVYAMAELDFLRNDADDGYDTYWFASAAFSRPITKALGLYGEVAVAKSSGGSAFEGTMGAGATLALTKNTWWDYAVYKGISKGAADWSHVLRFNWGF